MSIPMEDEDEVTVVKKKNDPLYLKTTVDAQGFIEKIIRLRIYETVYWKEECFGLTAETLVDKAVELTYIGGLQGALPSPFLCLLLKLLQLQPSWEIIQVYLENKDF
ncbi:Pre-mRNA-splicing factor 38A, partial [Coelomomyces lativittatus]